MAKKKLKLKKNVVNNIVIIILLIVVLTLFSFSVYIYNNNYEVNYYKLGSNEYSYIKINRISSTFAKVDSKELHFAEDKKNIYIIAINSNDKRYNNIINKENLTSIEIYVMPIKSNKKIKSIAKKNISKFKNIGDNNKSVINYYLDTTVTKYHKFNYIVSTLFLISMVIIGIVLKLIIKNKKRE